MRKTASELLEIFVFLVFAGIIMTVDFMAGDHPQPRRKYDL